MLELGVWLTNLGRDEADDEMRKRNTTRPLNKVLIAGPPKATAAFTTDELKDMDMVGLYELDISRNKTPQGVP